MEKNYITPEMKIFEFRTEDIITSSGGEPKTGENEISVLG